MNREVLGNALNKVIRKHADELIANALKAMDEKLQHAAGKVLIQTEQPDIINHNNIDVHPTPIENYMDAPVIDLSPLATALGGALNQLTIEMGKLGAAIIAVQKQNARDNQALQSQLAELLTAFKAMPAPQVTVEKPEPAPVPERPKREIVIERQGENKMIVREV